MLALLGVVTILALLVAVMSKRVSPLVALIVIPIAAALIGGGIWIAVNARRTGRRRANGGPHPATVVGAGIPPQPYPQAGQPHSPHYPQQPGQYPQAGQPRPSQYPHHQPYVGHPQSSPRGPSSGYGGGPSPLGAQPPAPGAPPKIDYRK